MLMSADEFVAARQHIMRDVYTQFCEQLCVAAERRKKTYDIRARPAQFNEGDRVYYFFPHR